MSITRHFRQLTFVGISYAIVANDFICIEDCGSFGWWTTTSDVLNRFHVCNTKQSCPILDAFIKSYHGRLVQIKSTMNQAFRPEPSLKPVYESISDDATVTV